MIVGTTLIVMLLKHVTILIAGAFIILAIAPVQEFSFRQDKLKNRLFLIAFFGLFGVLGTYSGNEIFNSIANLRAMAVVTAGFFGGPIVGLGAGLIAGGHRFLIDPWGFSAVACSLATILEGVGAGYIHHKYPRLHLNWRVATLFAIVGEMMHMVLVLVLSRPFDEALALVNIIAMPMIIGNGLGTALFVHLITIFKDLREKSLSAQAQKIFDITKETLGYLREGLNQKTATATAIILKNELGVAAVSVTNKETVLAHVGLGADHHLAGGPIATSSTKTVVFSGEAVFSKNQDHIGCKHPNCPFYSAIIVPLKKGESIIGTIKLYGSKNLELNRIQFAIAKGLTDLFSIQLELEDIQLKDRMLAHAEIRHLQAQINPHFLFNSLNTIASFCRTAPDKARELILDLSFYMRKNLDSSRGFIPLAEELEQIQSYLAIEKARFGSRITISIDVDPACEKWLIPSLIIQPLIENAIKHGIKDKEDGGKVCLSVRQDKASIAVVVKDDGLGMSPEKLGTILIPRSVTSHTNGLGGVGLQNSNQRLEQIYGPQYRMQITSVPAEGTEICFHIPHSSH